MNSPFDHTNIGLRERPLSSDHNQLESQIYQTMREVMRATFARRNSITAPASVSVSGFVGDGFRVVPSNPTAMSVVVASGLGFIYDATDLPSNIGSPDLEQVNDLSPYKPLYMANPVTFAVPTAPGAGLGRTDIIEIKVDRRLENALTRRQLDVGTESFLDHVFFKTLAYALDGRTGVVSAGGGNSTAGLSYKIGTAAAVISDGTSNPGRDNLTTVAPPVTSTGYLKIAEIHVNTGTVAVVDQMIVDRRVMLYAGGMVPFSAVWNLNWNSGAPIATLLSQVTPPGIRVGMRPDATARGRADFVIVGGELAVVVANATLNGSHGSITSAVVALAGSPSISLLSNTFAPITDLAVPALTVGLGSQFATWSISARYIDASVVNDTNANLQNIVYTVAGYISY